MSERRKIEERLRKKEQEIGVLEEKLRAAKVYSQALRDILKILQNETAGDPEMVLRPGSAVADARQVIRDRGVPVHINDILAALGREVTREAKASLTSSLAAYVRRNEIFTRPAPNTFGLAELGHETTEEKPSVPPDNFGKAPAPAPPDDDIPF